MALLAELDDCDEKPVSRAQRNAATLSPHV